MPEFADRGEGGTGRLRSSADARAVTRTAFGTWGKVGGMHTLVASLLLLIGADAKDDTVLQSLHPEVQRRIVLLQSKMGARRRQVLLTSGARQGDPADSLHNQSLAADVQVSGLSSPRVARELRRVGFSCAIPYYDSRGRPCRMAHGDLRHTPLAVGPYAPGSGVKECPALAISKTGGCHNDSKGQWQYFRVWPTALLRKKKRSPTS